MRSNLLIILLSLLTLTASARVSDKFSRHHSPALLPVAALSLGYMPIMSKDGHILVFPNPAIDRIFIKGDGDAVTRIELINMLGGVVLSDDIGSGTIAVSDLQPGVYIVRIYGAEGQLTLSSKLTKQ